MRALAGFAFWPVGPVNSRVMQTWNIKVKEQLVTVRCHLLSGYLSVLWYQKTPVQYYNKEEKERENVPSSIHSTRFWWLAFWIESELSGAKGLCTVPLSFQNSTALLHQQPSVQKYPWSCSERDQNEEADSELAQALRSGRPFLDTCSCVLLWSV